MGYQWRGMIAGVLAAAAMQAAAEPVKVRTDQGVLVGASDGKADIFNGIPYVAAPVGDLRWAPPGLGPAWKGERAADAYGPICPQKVNADGTPNEGGASGATSEDCLFLNVWAPAGAKKAPVMVWLHGGGNTLGAGSLGAYDGSAFVRDGVILVTINYRLGVLGFFAHPALTKAAGPDEPLISYGLMDQVAALEWVKRNIAAFGGDPANVTLFGESAGGADALALMTAPSARGLFAKAIVESGGGWSPPASLAKMEEAGTTTAQKSGAPADATLAQIRALPVDALVANAPRAIGSGVDGRFLKETPSQAFAAGRAVKVPLIIGSNSYEASLISIFKIPPAMALAMMPAGAKSAYADLPTDQARVDAMFTDSVMGAPARWVAGQASGGPSWLYYFSYVLAARQAKTPGAGHATEIPYVFDSWDKVGPFFGGLPVTDADKAVVSAMHGCWITFAKTSTPVCPGAPAWPAYTAASDTLMEFGPAPPALRKDFRKPQLDAQQAAVLPTLDLGH